MNMFFLYPLRSSRDPFRRAVGATAPGRIIPLPSSSRNDSQIQQKTHCDYKKK